MITQKQIQDAILSFDKLPEYLPHYKIYASDLLVEKIKSNALPTDEIPLIGMPVLKCSWLPYVNEKGKNVIGFVMSNIGTITQFITE